MALATLSIDLVAKLAEMQSGLDRAGRLNERTAAAIEARWEKAGKMAGAAFAGVGAALAAIGVLDRFRVAINGLDALNDAADATGASIGNLSALEDIALRTGTSFETATGAVVKLNQALGAAKPGSDQAAVFEAIGLSVEKLKKEDPAEALRQVAVALSAFSDDGDKARAVQELFGKSIREVAPLLKDLSEQSQLNATVTAEQAQQAEEFNKQLSALSKSVTDVTRGIVGQLLPALNELFNAGRSGGIKGIGDQIGEYFGLGKDFYAARNLKRLADDLAEVQNRVANVGPLSMYKRGLEAELAKATKDWEAARDAYIKVRGLDGPATDAAENFSNEGRRPKRELRVNTPVKVPGLKAPSDTKTLGGTSNAFASMSEALRAIDQTDIAKAQKLSEVYDELVNMRSSGLGGGPGLEEAIANIREELAKLDPVQVAAAESRKRLNELLSQTPGGKLDKVLIDVELLNRAFAAGQVDAEKWAEGVRVATAQLGADGAAELKEMSGFATEAARSIQDSLGSTIEAALGGNFDNIGKMWGDMLKRMVAQAAAAQVNKALFGADFGKTGEVGGFAGQAVDWLKQVDWGSIFGARANGGPVSAGTPYIVGERGPEIVVPRVAGMVLRNGVMPQAQGGGTTISNQIVVQGDASENTLRLVQGALANFEARLMSRNR